jgi:uncharacterized protein YndB with AHSA1/START domain
VERLDVRTPGEWDATENWAVHDVAGRTEDVQRYQRLVLVDGAASFVESSPHLDGVDAIGRCPRVCREDADTQGS